MNDLSIHSRLYQIQWNEGKSSCLIFKYGPKGIMWNIVGNGFYTATYDQLKQVYIDLNIQTLEGYISIAHVRLMTRALRDKATVEVISTEFNPKYHPDDQTYAWVKVVLKEIGENV